MARRQVSMNEIVEMVYQWHQGRSIQGIERSFGTDRNTIRKYVRLAQATEGQVYFVSISSFVHKILLTEVKCILRWSATSL